jgi:MoxR-like ATPase
MAGKTVAPPASTTPAGFASRIATLDGVDLRLALPDEMPVLAVASDSVKHQLRACWLTPGGTRRDDPPLSPRILGQPGVGKTTLAYTIGKEFSREVYIFQCTSDTRPEDLLVTPVIDSGQVIRYHASALTTAMIRGGVCILDEGNRMSEKSWAALAPLLDSRRYVESIIAGIKIHAHADFRVCVTMNEDSSTYDIPEYILSRLQPQVRVGFPTEGEEREILKVNLPFADDELLDVVSGFLGRAHKHNLPVASRDGIHIVRYAERLRDTLKLDTAAAVEQAATQIVGEEFAQFLDPAFEPAPQRQVTWEDAEVFLAKYKAGAKGN